MVGDLRQQRTAGDLVEIGDGIVEIALVTQRLADERDSGIFDSRGEIEQHAVGAEVLDILRIKILDRRKYAVSQQLGPIVVGAHMHAPLIAAKGLGRVHQRFVIGFGGCRRRQCVVCVVMAVHAIAISAQSIH